MKEGGRKVEKGRRDKGGQGEVREGREVRIMRRESKKEVRVMKEEERKGEKEGRDKRVQSEVKEGRV